MRAVAAWRRDGSFRSVLFRTNSGIAEKVPGYMDQQRFVPLWSLVNYEIDSEYL